MTQLNVVFLFCFLYVQIAFANVEKVIFLGPSNFQIPTIHPTLEVLQLQALSPEHSVIRTELRAAFPTNSSTKGEASWLLLEQLTEGQRYEVRICWAATQPTSFHISTYEPSGVFESVELITSLAAYSQSRQSQAESLEHQTPSIPRSFKKSEYGSDELQSVLFIQIFAAADYYTTNRTLMDHVPPVLVDIILDPYVLNVFPQSLVSTAYYLIILAFGSWYLAKLVAKWLQMVARTDDQKKDI